MEDRKPIFFCRNIHTFPKIGVIDDPSNHLDFSSRQLLYDFIQSSKSYLIVVSHDRKFLNLLDKVFELSQDIHNEERELRKAKERSTIERQQSLTLLTPRNHFGKTS